MTMNEKPVRILHVVGGMNRGGAETWLMHVLRYIDRDRFLMDFLVHTTEPCAYDDEIKKLGSKIIPCLHPSKPLTYARNFRRILAEFGPYDIVHSHVHSFNGYILRLAYQAKVPIRIAHSHNDMSILRAEAGILRQLYITTAKRWILRYATNGIAVSNKAAVDLFGLNWAKDKRWKIIHCAIDLAPFSANIDSVAIRKELGIPADALVIGHVGRFMKQKNHGFLVEIAAEVFKREPRAYLLLVGDGRLHSTIEQKVAQLGLGDRVIFAGSRSDVAKLMMGAIDVFVMPSLYEGLGLVLIEAQASGLPCIISDCIPEEADVIKTLVRRLSLSQPASTWAGEVLEASNNNSSINRTECLVYIEASLFNAQTGVRILELYYESGREHA